MGKRTVRPFQRRVKVRRRLLVERLGERRVLAAITGAVFEDVNHSLQKDAAEENVPRRLVYVDANDNATLDVGEVMAVAGQDGNFRFDNLDDGTYLLRLFNGTQSQVQTTPVEATIEGGSFAVADAIDLAVGDGTGLALTANSLVLGDLQSGESETVSVGSQLSRMDALPDGSLLIVGTNASGDTSWIVDPESRSVTPVDLTNGGQGVAWSDVAIDGNGLGVLLEQSAGMSAIRKLDASDAEAGIQVTTTSEMVPAGTQVLTSQTGVRSVIAWAGNDGLELSLWSNETASYIGSSTDVSGTTGLLAFDDASGLLAVRTASGGVSVHDVNDTFKPLHTLDDAGPVAIDGARDLLMTVSPLDEMLKIINLKDGTLIADLAIDLSEIGQVASLAMGNTPDSVVVLGAAGAVEVALRKPDARRVTIVGGQDPDPVQFGVAFGGDNAAPAYSSLPTFETNEDSPLTSSAPAALNVSADADGDDYVLVQLGPASNGTATVRIDGSISYVPNDNFNGTDSVLVLLHDGRDVSAEVTLNIVVNPVPDSPTDVDINIDPVPEDILPGEVIGDIEIIDADGPGHTIVINDPRFGNRGEEIIFVTGDIDFETEPAIPIVVTVTDTETNDVIEENVTVTIRDANDPITAITPTEAFVFENAPGDVVTELSVHDQDVEQFHTFTVDDERFTVEGYDLRLVDGVSVDFEVEESITVNVTATEVGTGGTFTQAINIAVRDLPEQPETLTLSNATVIELTPGAAVADVKLDNRSPDSRYNLTVDDPRFEIDAENSLKLLDDQFVVRANQSQIQLTITATDSQNQFNPISEIFVIEVLENATPSHNHDNPYDVNHGGDVTAVDALAIINYLNTYGPGPVGEGDLGLCYDVNADGFVTALDALLVLNEIGREDVTPTVGDGESSGEGEDRSGDNGGEGEQLASDDPAGNSPSLGQPIANAPDGGEASGGEASRGLFADNGAHDLAGGGTALPQTSRSIAFVYENTGERTRTLRGISPDDSAGDDATDSATGSISRDFAERVDRTIRLLSDRTS